MQVQQYKCPCTSVPYWSSPQAAAFSHFCMEAQHVWTGLSAEVTTRMQSGLWPSWILIGGLGEESFSKLVLGRIQFLATVGFKSSLLWRVAPSVIKKAMTCQSNSSHVLTLWLLVLQLARENALLLKSLSDQVRPARQSPFD